MKCEQINYRKCESNVNGFNISCSSNGGYLQITEASGRGFLSNPYSRLSIEKAKAKEVLLEALAIIEELE